MVVRNPAWKNYKDKCLTPAPVGYVKLSETHYISSVRRQWENKQLYWNSQKIATRKNTSQLIEIMTYN